LKIGIDYIKPITDEEFGIMKAYTLKISGEVQGVFYRHHAKKEAQKLGLAGWAKNEHDGTVTLFIQGEEGLLAKMIAWSKEGSPLAEVEEVVVLESDLIAREGFEIK
jgi:acylphosphatase